MTADHVPLREFIERIIAENNLRRDDLRTEDRRWLEASIASVEKALKLQATELERRLDVLNHAHDEARRVLGTYAQLKDFNELKERVSIELADRTGKSKSLPLVVSIGSFILSLFVAGAVYLKP